MQHIHNTRQDTIRWVVALIDVVLVMVCFGLAYYLCKSGTSFPVTRFGFRHYILFALMAYLPIAFFLHPDFTDGEGRADLILQQSAKTCCKHVLLLVALLFSLHDNTVGIRFILCYAALLFPCMFLCRIGVSSFALKSYKPGHKVRHIVLAGDVDDIAGLLRHFSQNAHRASVLGVFTDSDDSLCHEVNVKRLGGIRDMLPYLHEHGKDVDDLYCTPSAVSVDGAIAVSRCCDDCNIAFRSLPAELYPLHNAFHTQYRGEQLVLSPTVPYASHTENRILKRCLDIIISGLFLLTLFPVIYVIVAIIIKVQSPGPVFFVRERIKWDGTVLHILEFRTFHFYSSATEAEADVHAEDNTFPFGELLRSTHVDKLPQFINVFFGSMSIVGSHHYAPDNADEVARTVNIFSTHNLAKPGLTRWSAAVCSDSGAMTHPDISDCMASDQWYTARQTFWLDVLIACKSLSRHNPPSV